MTVRKLAVLGAFSASLLLAGSALALDKVRFGTNWVAEPEHGGFYQAVADGTYAKCGLDVEIVPGGPQVNNRAQMMAGKLQFNMGGNMLQMFSAAKQGIPIKVVASMFQKDPQVIMTHPGQGLDTWASLKGIDLMLGNAGYVSFFQWMISEYGFKPEQRKPYNFNPAPFIADKRAGQQGYVTSEPYAVEKQGGFTPNVFLLADQGWSTYSTTIEVMDQYLAGHAKQVQCFVDGSILGWVGYLYGDPAKANAMIKKDNPDMTDDQIAFSIKALKKYGVVDSGDSLKLGIGAMTAKRHEAFYKSMVKSGVVKPGLDVTKTYTLKFVNKGVGLDLKKKLMK